MAKKIAAAPPSDAAQPVAWRWYIEGQTGGWHYSNVRITQSGKRQIIEPLYAHPEDAPEGRHETQGQKAIRIHREILSDPELARLVLAPFGYGESPQWLWDRLKGDKTDD